MPGDGNKKPQRRRKSRREVLDLWFPTVIRYVGVVLIVYSALVDRGRNPALIPAATGMFFFKTVYGAGGGGKE